ncbi:MAG TPA: hypothetical protein VF131_21785, partial [Blastocatellia bacterium]|nr:hypothetical protein [Blastocatellia bacterium]
RDVKLSADKSSGLLFSPPTFNSCRPGGAVSAVMNSKRFSYPDGRERTSNNLKMSNPLRSMASIESIRL